MKFNLRRAIFEFLSIVIAVVLAMTLTEWRQEYLNKELAQRSLENIIEEVQQNRSELIQDSTRINRDLEFMNLWISAYDENLEMENFSLDFSYSFLSNSALEVAKINNSLTFLENTVNMQIAEMYATQDFYSENALKLFDTIGKLGSNFGSENLGNFVALVRELRFQMLLIKSTIGAFLSETELFLKQQNANLASELANP